MVNFHILSLFFTLYVPGNIFFNHVGTVLPELRIKQRSLFFTLYIPGNIFCNHVGTVLPELRIKQRIKSLTQEHNAVLIFSPLRNQITF